MVSGRLLDKLEAVARAVRKDPRPFGGIQLLVNSRATRTIRVIRVIRQWLGLRRRSTDPNKLSSNQ